MTEPETLRVFLGVPAPAAWVERARELVSALRGEMPDASWTRPESWHVTLHFLGEISRSQADRFAAEIAPITETATGGDLETSGAVIFPPHGRARALAAGFAESATTASLARLAASADQLSRQIQNPKPVHRSLGEGGSKIQNHFRPHVTFARLRRPWPREAVVRFQDELSRWRAPAWRVETCILFRSRLGAGGSVYTPLHAFRLASSREEALR